MSTHAHRPTMRIKHLLGRFRRDRRGVAAIEFALILPILVLLALGCFEVPRYVMLWQRMERAASGVSDLVAQADEPLTLDQLTDIMSSGKLLMQPYDVMASGNIIVTSVNNPTGGTTNVSWRVTCGSGGNTSKMGAVSSEPPAAQTAAPSANFPTSLLPLAKDNEVLVTEVYYTFTPVFKTFIYTGSTLYANAFTRPRNHNLTTGPNWAGKTVRCPPAG